MADLGTGLSGALGGAGTGFTIGGPIGAGVGGLVGLLSGLFGGNKKQSTWMSTLTPQQQKAYSQMLNYMMQNYNQQPQGNAAANMGYQTLMNKFYPGMNYQTPSLSQQGYAAPAGQAYQVANPYAKSFANPIMSQMAGHPGTV